MRVLGGEVTDDLVDGGVRGGAEEATGDGGAALHAEDERIVLVTLDHLEVDPVGEFFSIWDN